MGQIRTLVRLAASACDHAVGWLLLALVAINGASVFMRYVVGDSISWSEEAIRYLAIWITFLGSAAASWNDEHLDMNLFAEAGGPVFRAAQRAVLHLLNTAFAGVLAWQGWIYCVLNGMQTAPTTGLPMIYVYGAIALGGFLLVAVHLVKAADALLAVRGR
jgi:TRAP-type C4-dicarboxylate transport system permease small subunit